jgi:hypothetical protein
VFHLIDDCEYPLLYLPGTGITSQEIVISGSSQQNLAGVCNILGLVVVCGMDPQVEQTLDGTSFHLSYSLSSEIYLCKSFHGYFVPHSKKEQDIHTLVFLLLDYHVF